MSDLTSPSRGFMRLFRDFSRLGMRSVILTALALALLNVAVLTVVSTSSDDFDTSLMGPPIVRQAAAAARLMDTLSPENRVVALAAVNSPSLHLSLTDDFSRTPPVENPQEVFVPVISMYAAVLGERPFSVFKRTDEGISIFRRATLADDLIVVMRLEDGSGLVVESGEQLRRMAGYYGIALIFGVVSLVLIGLMTWASLSYSGPLSRLASASKGFVEGANSASGFNPLPETGPRPVRELAAALNLTGSQLVRLTVERTTTLAAVAHDLRTYLTRLRMRSEFIEDDAQRTKTVQDIEDMTQLIEDTLFLGQSATKAPEQETVDVAAWLSDFVARRVEVGQPVAFETPKQTAKIDLATSELARVLNNLLDNALRYAGEATLVLAQADEEALAIEVLDRGPGVPDAFIDEMTHAFTRLEASRSRDTGGSGLGLAISKALVEQIGGTLELSNRKEGGFRARVTLPVSAKA